ncbi:MAG: hypothetical protein KDA24_00265 [Deltaproteobacteria bacterium]|nr:hypothetical protein [Deltaproteobacteria bacterium]
MTQRFARALLLCALVLPLGLSSGCMTGKIPSAAFAGMTVRTVQKEPGSQKVELDVGFNFKVKNPTGIKLKVPGHDFGLQIDGSNVASTGTKKGFDVAAGTAKTIKYDFRVDLSEDGVGKAFGKDATIAFTADANVDVPKEIIDILGQIPGAEVVSDEAKKAGEGLLSTGLQALEGSAGEGLGKAKLTFAHEGNLRLPKFPKIKGKEGAKPEVALVGTSETANVDNLIGELTSKVEPLAAFLEQFENAAVNQKVDIPVGELLERIGVPSNLTSAALTAINGVLQLNGKSTIGSKNNSVQVPVDLPKLTTLLGTLDPKAAKKINDFQAGWVDFKNNPTIGNLVIPTALPQGIRISTPFNIENPNEFAVTAPSFKLGIVAADGTPVALIGVAAPGVMGANLGSTKQQHLSIGAQGSSELQLMSEFNWDKLGTNLLSAAATGAKPDFTGLRLMGEISIDPGYGPITVPINIPLAGGTTSTTSNQTSSKATGSSSSSSSSSSGSSSKGSSSSSSSKGSGSSSSSTGSGSSSSSSSKKKKKKK